MFPQKILIQYGAVRKYFAKSEMIFKEENAPKWFYQIEKGEVHLFNLSETGKIFIQGFFKKEESFGEPPLLGGFAYPINAVAYQNTTLLCLSLKNLQQMLEEQPHLHLKLTQQLSRRLNYKSQILQQISTASPEKRIYFFLDLLKQKQNETGTFTVPYTRKEIAYLTGFRIETVIRAVKKLEQKKKLKIVNRKIHF